MTISGSLLSLDGRDSKLLINVALGKEKADMAIVNARLLNVYTGELIDDFSVSVKGKWIAYVGDDPKDTIGPKTVVIDAGRRKARGRNPAGRADFCAPYDCNTSASSALA